MLIILSSCLSLTILEVSDFQDTKAMELGTILFLYVLKFLCLIISVGRICENVRREGQLSRYHSMNAGF
jgi:hypothetical protein